MLQFVGKMLKRTAIFGLAFGAAFAVVGILGFLVVNWYASRPKSWDAKSITCVSSTAVPTYQVKPETGDIKPAGFSFTFALANNTGRDYTVPQNIKFFKRSASAKALADFTATIEHAVLIPARERAELNLWTDYSCSNFDTAGHETQRDPETCFHDAFDGAIGFVALDDKNRIRLDLPKPPLQAPKDERGSGTRQQAPSRLLPPNKGNVFDQIAACMEAARLVDLCTRKGIGPGKGAPAAYGGSSASKLDSLPTPLEGSKLDASPITCGIAYEWNNYCQVHNK